MRKVGPATGVILSVLVATCLTVQAAPAAGTSGPRPAPFGSQSGAFSPAGAAPTTALQARTSALQARTAVALAPVACDGKFDVVASPNGTGNNYLVSVSAINVNDVWAVGNSTSSTGFDRTLAEHWNGSTWTVVSTPNASSFHNDLTGVSAISTNDVWAVGTYQSDSLGDLQTFAEHWDGIAWTLKSTFNPSFFSILSAVTAVASNDVWAVGTYFNGVGFQTLIEHWDGFGWTQISSPNPDSSDDELEAVSAFNSTDIWAVGEFGATNTTPALSLAEHWNGANWTLVSTPNLGGPSANNVIFGVAALEAGHAVGVGFGNLTGTTPRAGAAWDLIGGGSSTSQFESGPGAGDNALLAVARSGAGIWAVGYWRNTASSARQTLVIPATFDATLHTVTWGGVRISASPSSINNALIGVAAISPSVFWATGYSSISTTVDHTLTELYCGLHFNLSAPTTGTTGVPFSLNVTAANADASTATGYVGTVHFTSTDPLAVLPGDYTFTPGDAGTHTFTVTLNTPYSQTITVNDTVTPFVKGSFTLSLRCSGACQSAGGTPGGRGVNPGPGGSPGPRAVNPSSSGAIGPRVPQSPAAVGGLHAGTPQSAKPAATIKSVVRIELSSRFGAGFKSATSIAKTSFEAYREPEQAAVSARTVVSAQATNALTRIEIAIPIGLLVFALLALRRRRNGEELSVHNQA